MDTIIENENKNKQWTHMLNDLQRNKLDTLMLESILFKKKHTHVNDNSQLEIHGYDVQFMIVNEISMVGCMMFVTMHLKSEKLQSSILQFGGLNIMFMGGFLQFSPIIDTPLLSTNIQPTFTFTNSTQKKS